MKSKFYNGIFYSGKLFGGKGELTPDTYRELEYIKSTGTQYIVTDIIPKYGQHIELDAMFGSQNNSTETAAFIGIQTTDSWLIAAFEPGVSGNFDYCAFYVGYPWSSTMSQDHVIADVSYTSRNVIQISHPSCSFGSKSCTLTESVTQSEPTVGLTVFGATNTGVSAGVRIFQKRDTYCYGLKVYDENNDLIYDLIPVERERDGAAGLYDRVTGKFYGNAGTGEFVKGGYV